MVLKFFWADFVWKEANANTEDYQKKLFKRVGQLSSDQRYDFSPSYISMTLSTVGSSESHEVLVCIQYQQMYRILFNSSTLII
jgi:hypothetical protein